MRSRILTAALFGAVIATPAIAQFSESYNFLKAVRERDGQVVTDLIGSGGTVVDTRDRATGETALHIVTKRRDVAWLGFLIGKGANVNARANDGETPLLAAARIGFTEGAQTLIRRGAQVDLGNSGGETPLMRAVQNRDLAMVRLLIGAGANPDRPDAQTGLSAREFATRDGRSQAILRVLDEPREAPAARARPVAGPN